MLDEEIDEGFAVDEGDGGFIGGAGFIECIFSEARGGDEHTCFVWVEGASDFSDFFSGDFEFGVIAFSLDGDADAHMTAAGDGDSSEVNATVSSFGCEGDFFEAHF